MPGKREGHGVARVRCLQRGPDFGIAFGRPKSHHDVFGPKDGFEPGPKENGKIQRRQRALAHNDRMNEFHRDMLRVGGVGSASKGQQPAAAQKAFRHLAAGFGQARRFAREKVLEQLVALRAAALRSGREFMRFAHIWRSQQIRGSGSPTSISTMRLPP